MREHNRGAVNDAFTCDCVADSAVSLTHVLIIASAAAYMHGGGAVSIGGCHRVNEKVQFPHPRARKRIHADSNMKRTLRHSSL